MLRHFAVSAVVLAAMAGAVSAQEVTRRIPVDGEFAEGQFTWSGMGSGYEYRVRMIAVDGLIELCGVGAYTNAQLRPTVEDLLRGAQLKINGRTVLRGFRFFAQANRPSDLDRAVANCTSTGTPVPRGEIEVDVDWPDGTFRN